MEDYDPTAFRRTTGDVLAAWAVCMILFASILFGSFINSSAEHDEQNVSVVANNVLGSVRASDTAQKSISSYEQLRKTLVQKESSKGKAPFAACEN